MGAPSNTPNAYTRLYYPELKIAALAHWDSAAELRAILDALKTRRKKKAHLLRLYIEERIKHLPSEAVLQVAINCRHVCRSGVQPNTFSLQ